MVSNEKPTGPALQTAAAMTWLLGIFGGFGVVAAAPFVVARVCGEGWGILAGVTLGAAWMRFMPTTCFNGGLIWSMLGIWQLLLLGFWSVRGVVAVVSRCALSDSGAV